MWLALWQVGHHTLLLEQTHRHGDSMTESAQWGQFSNKEDQLKFNQTKTVTKDFSLLGQCVKIKGVHWNKALEKGREK